MDDMTKNSVIKICLISGRKIPKPKFCHGKLLHRGIRYRKNYKESLKPDIAITRCHIAVFVDGDFWHARGHQENPGEQVGSNPQYWQKKLKRNVERDKEVNDALTSMGWLVLRFWASDVEKELDIYVSKSVTTVELLFRYSNRF